jgi:ApbE superfamily uncharacterized protein (UPF0280 family)
MLSTSAFCKGPWNVKQACGLPHRTLRRIIMDVALSVRGSTTRQQHPQTIEQHVARLQAYLARQPDWHLAEEPLDRDDG